jgi:hypothetical protein
MSPEEVIGKFVSFELMIKGSKKIIEQGTSSMPEAQPVAFKATEEKKEESTSSRLPIDASKLDNEEMALIIKSFRQILKQKRGKDYKPHSHLVGGRITNPQAKNRKEKGREMGTWADSVLVGPSLISLSRVRGPAN